MKKSELLYKLTGTEDPQFITKREEKIIEIALEIINSKEEENNSIKESIKCNKDCQKNG